jgi:predicted ArsR family transcriptional regulator
MVLMEDSKATQRMKILQYCEEHGSITIREAFERLFINSPSKRISEMRHSQDYDVQTEVVKPEGKRGYKRYYITVRGNA